MKRLLCVIFLLLAFLFSLNGISAQTKKSKKDTKESVTAEKKDTKKKPKKSKTKSNVAEKKKSQKTSDESSAADSKKKSKKKKSDSDVTEKKSSKKRSDTDVTKKKSSKKKSDESSMAEEKTKKKTKKKKADSEITEKKPSKKSAEKSGIAREATEKVTKKSPKTESDMLEKVGIGKDEVTKRSEAKRDNIEKDAESSSAIEKLSRGSKSKEMKEKPKEATNTSEDKIIGTDEKGRTIYEGPRGGRYYLTEAGNKVYVTNKKP